MSRIVAIVVFYVCTMLYGERERQRTKNVTNQPKVKILYSYISYVIHTSLTQFICFCKFQLFTCGDLRQVWQQQASRKQQIGCPCVLQIKANNAITTIIKAFTTNCLQPSINT